MSRVKSSWWSRLEINTTTIVTEAWRQKIIDHQPYFKKCSAKHRVMDKNANVESSENNLSSSN